MSRDQQMSKVAVVTGDVTIDWNVGRLRTAREGVVGWNADDTARACWQRGGAMLLADVIEAVAQMLRRRRDASYEVRGISLPSGPIHPADDRFHHSYAMWAPFICSERVPGDRKWVWRVEEFLGLDQARSSGNSGANDWRQVKDDPAEADLVVLDDAGLGFRDQPHLWPRAIKAKQGPGWILVKMASLVAEGPLWEHLISNCADRLVIVIPVNDLRRTEVHISRELSWERTAQDLFWELAHNPNDDPKVNALSRCAHVVISFNTVGALLLSRPRVSSDAHDLSASQDCKLFFDPMLVEGMWGQDHPGGTIGYTTCLTAGIARQLMLAPHKPDIDKGIQSGVAATRKLHLDGYGTQDPSTPLNPPAFPTKTIAAELAKSKAPLAVASVQDPVRSLHESAPGDERTSQAGFWTILDDLCDGRQDQQVERIGRLEEVARRIVLEEPGVAVQGVPLGQFGSLVTADRREIEGYRSIRTLIAEYCRQPQKSPLSIAGFGPPGSGKSFGVEQVANSVRRGAIEKCTFNLSQFNDPSELVDALHQVRDIGLSGKIPLVFWDEFDTSLGDQEFGWLRHFLAPMQDGSFHSGQITHHIGPSIFVFAGGTNARMADFDRGREHEDFRKAKGPDFVSRLKGYVNIMGPNPYDEIDPARDPHYLVRRAIMLRSLLRRNAPQLFEEPNGEGQLNVDSGVLRAFLHTGQYKHGVRSMEAVISMSTLTGKSRFERSCLPAEAQLDLHVDGLEFLALVQQPELEGELLEELAEATHQVFCESQNGKEREEKEKSAPAALLAYEELSPDDKEQNRAYVRDIIAKLTRVGYVMIPAPSNEPPF